MRSHEEDARTQSPISYKEDSSETHHHRQRGLDHTKHTKTDAGASDSDP